MSATAAMHADGQWHRVDTKRKAYRYVCRRHTDVVATRIGLQPHLYADDTQSYYPKDSTSRTKSTVYNINRIDPRTKPCGTPNKTDKGVEALHSLLCSIG